LKKIDGVIKYFVWVSLLILWAATQLSCSKNESNLKKITLQKNNSSASITLGVEIADTDESRMRGLMFRKELDAKQGMLFIFDRDTDTPFWMKNTYLPLDILFINADHEIVDIKERATPLSEELIHPNAPYRLALEVNGGFAKDHQIETGDKVAFQTK
jgi:uncharacterized membrane protein (UPF0127 family)